MNTPQISKRQQHH